MVGRRRLDNVQRCVEDVLAHGVPGDFIEAGVWRGGVAILMRALLLVHGVEDRLVFAADSFRGLPRPDEETYPADRGDSHHTFEALAVDEATVRANFARYGLLDDRVRFLAGWFKNTLPTVADRRWAVIRIDGDMYESTMTALVNLYPGLSAGGYVIVDDHGALPAARRAVEDFREAHGIGEPIERIDWTGICWRRTPEEVTGAAAAPRPPVAAPPMIGDVREYWLERVDFAVRDTYFGGIKLKKFPEDLRVYEDLLWESRANVVIEIGASEGGSALWFRDRLRTLQGYGRAEEIKVVAIDLETRLARALLGGVDPAFGETIELVEGDVRDPQLAQRVAELLPEGARCFVVDDSANTYESTTGALRNFSRFVPVGGFMVVEDGCVDIESMRLTDRWPRGVLPALRDWLATPEGSRFTQRRDLERYGISCHPGGFLERLAV